MPLFSRDAAPSAGLVLTTTTPLGKEQKTFNSLIRKIDARRAELAEWAEAVGHFRQRYLSDLLPLRDEETDLYAQLVRSLDQAHGQKGVTKGEKRKLSSMIAQLAQLVLERIEDDEIKALYNTHSHSDFDAEVAAQQDSMKSMLEDMLDMDLGDDVDLSSPEAVIERMQSQFRAEQEAIDAQAKPRKKTARQLARDARLEAEEKQLSQSIREVYRKLASALHPDREPDPAERLRKTTLMQQANEAYQSGNLLQLLELQLQLEQIDHAHLANLDGNRLKHYIKILRDQLKELETEIDHIEYSFVAEFGLSSLTRLNPKDLMSILQDDIDHCANIIRQAELDLENAADPKRLKAWLKMIKVRRQSVSGFDIPF